MISRPTAMRLGDLHRQHRRRKIGPNDIRSPSGVAFNAGHRQTLESSGFEIVAEDLECAAAASSSAKRPFTQKAYPTASARRRLSCAATPGPRVPHTTPVSHKSTLRELVGDALVVRRVVKLLCVPQRCWHYTLSDLGRSLVEPRGRRVRAAVGERQIRSSSTSPGKVPTMIRRVQGSRSVRTLCKREEAHLGRF
jgi:hypothetical protein